MIERVGSQASERRTERSDGLNPLGLRSGRSESSASQPRASRVIPPNPTPPARSHYWLPLSVFPQDFQGLQSGLHTSTFSPANKLCGWSRQVSKEYHPAEDR